MLRDSGCRPVEVVAEATRQWSALWQPGPRQLEAMPPQPGDDAVPDVAQLPGMGPLDGNTLWDIARRLPSSKAQGLDAWGPAELRALPRGPAALWPRGAGEPLSLPRPWPSRWHAGSRSFTAQRSTRAEDDACGIRG